MNRLLLFVPVLLLALAGCGMSLLQPGSDAAEIHVYTLEWTPSKPAASPPGKGPTLLIAPPRANAGYTGSDMIYVRRAYELDHYLYHRWADSPARMLEPLLLLAAERSGLFGQVIPAGTQALPDLRLDSRLLHLRQVFGRNGCRVEFGIRIDLVDVASGRVRGSRTFGYDSACDQPSPEGGVATVNRLVGRFLDELGPALEQILRG